jgi:hypothetical protein
LIWHWGYRVLVTGYPVDSKNIIRFVYIIIFIRNGNNIRYPNDHSSGFDSFPDSLDTYKKFNQKRSGQAKAGARIAV